MSKKKETKERPKMNASEHIKKVEGLTVRKRAMLEALTKSLGMVTQACDQTGVGRTTHYDWMNNDPEYKAEVEAITDRALDFVESKLLKQIQDDELTAIIFYLKCKGKKRGYVERQEVELEATQTIKRFTLNVLPDDPSEEE